MTSGNAPPRVANCLRCNTPLEQPKHGGRPRKYCGKAACRKAASRVSLKAETARQEQARQDGLRKQWLHYGYPEKLRSKLEDILLLYGTDAAEQAGDLLHEFIAQIEEELPGFVRLAYNEIIKADQLNDICDRLASNMDENAQQIALLRQQMDMFGQAIQKMHSSYRTILAEKLVEKFGPRPGLPPGKGKSASTTKKGRTIST